MLLHRGPVAPLARGATRRTTLSSGVPTGTSSCRRPSVAARVASKEPQSTAGATKQDEKVVVPDAAPSRGTPPPPPPPEPEHKRKTRGQIAISKVADEVFDAVSDVGRHLGRQLSNLPSGGLLRRNQKSDGRKVELRREGAKPVVLVLGSGWGAHAVIKVVDTDMYDVILVSPRNFFMFTPMLPSTAVGTIEPRSLLEPIRISNEYVGYLEAACEQIDMRQKIATCIATGAHPDGHHPTFNVAYDILVCAVGEQPATLGVPGVAEHAIFMKEITDTRKIRKMILGNFELAALPGATDEERRRLLHFIVVGGGPTGVEFSGTLSDYLRKDLRKKFPELMPFVAVTLLQSAKAILTQFDETLAQRAMENLQNEGVEVRTGVRVVQITDKQVVLKGGERIDYGLCVWSAGNMSRPLVQGLVDLIPEQAALQKGGPPTFKLATDPFLRVVGAKDVIAIGDCSNVLGQDAQLPPTAQVAAQQGAYAAHMINRGFVLGVGGMDRRAPTRVRYGLLQPVLPPLSSVDLDMDLSSYETAARNLRTASDADIEEYRRVFEFFNLGIMAYVGGDKAAIDTQVKVGEQSISVYGSLAFLLWRSVYLTKQVSLRNRVLILFDWLKAQVFGRDLSMF